MPIPYLSIGAALASSVFSYIGAQQQRKQAIKDQDNQFVRMRNAAQRAGFNPLTVMRLTGGQGFTGLPTLSKAAAFGNAVGGIFDALKNAPIEKYQKQVRDLTLKGMKADIANTLANTAYTGIMSKQALSQIGLNRLQAKLISQSDMLDDKESIGKAINDERVTNAARSQTPSVYRAYGLDWRGSGLFSYGEQAEAAFGENPILSTLMFPALAGDMVGYTLGQAQSSRQQKKADKAVEEWFSNVKSGKRVPGWQGMYIGKNFPGLIKDFNIPEYVRQQHPVMGR